MKKKGQNLIEYILIASLVALVSVIIVTKFNIVKLRNYVFVRPASSDTTNEVTSTKIKIEAMTN